MDKPSRRRFAVFALPMIIGLISALRAAPHVRAVDFVLLFASGVLFGVGLMGFIRMWKRPGSSFD